MTIFAGLDVSDICAPAMGSEDRRIERQQACQDCGCPQVGGATSFAMVERDGVPLGMTPAPFFPVSHARVISPGRDHEGSDIPQSNAVG